MKIICISDTHLRTDLLDLPPGDLLLHAGDATMGGSVAEFVKFNEQLGIIKDRYKHGILFNFGNHDFLGEKDLLLAKIVLSNCTCLQSEAIEIEGIKFYFSPYVPNLPRWAFHRDDKGLEEAFAKIPEDTDFLVTHGPPYGILDEIDLDNMSRKGLLNEHVGSWPLLSRIKQLKELKYSIFGHIHESYGQKSVDGVEFINASICDERYNPINKPIIIDI